VNVPKSGDASFALIVATKAVAFVGKAFVIFTDKFLVVSLPCAIINVPAAAEVEGNLLTNELLKYKLYVPIGNSNKFPPKRATPSTASPFVTNATAVPAVPALTVSIPAIVPLKILSIGALIFLW
jgi:hypothetical protein